MPDVEKVIAAYVCSNEKLPDKKCEKCPYGYEYIDQTGDNYFVWCNTERIIVDAIDLLKAQEPIEPYIERDGRTTFFLCGGCNKPLCIAKESYKPKYCPECRRKVKWE